MAGSDLRRWAALLLCTLGLLLAAAMVQPGRGVAPEAEVPRGVGEMSHPALFFDPTLFSEAVSAADSVAQPQGAVAGGIIPHHLLAGHLIAAFFRGLAGSEPPRTIVLIGPNHPNAGRARALTSELPWETPFGIVEPDRRAIEALTSSGVLSVEDPVLTTEHSVAGIMPFIKYYLPNAAVVPVILSGETTPAEATRLGEAIAALGSDGVVVVASVDFSHYLVASEAEARDVTTLQALRAGDAATLFTLNSDYLDSPPSIATLMAAMSARGAGFELLEHTNSGVLLQDELAPTTSYFLAYYRPDDPAVARRR